MKTLSKGALHKIWLQSCLMCAIALLVSTAQAESNNPDPDAVGIEKTGNLLQWGIPLIGWGLTFLLNQSQDADSFTWRLTDGAEAPGLNWPGPHLNHSPRHDFLVSFTRMEVATYALKYTINAQRPNGGHHSFPSGHTASAFMGAEFIRMHFGLTWGIPAYGAAAWVGFSRVESRKHYLRDVVGGALIGIAANYDWTNVDTPIGKLYFGPALLTTPDHSAWNCEVGVSRNCFKDTPKLTPGLQLELRF